MEQLHETVLLLPAVTVFCAVYVLRRAVVEGLYVTERLGLLIIYAGYRLHVAGRQSRSLPTVGTLRVEVSSGEFS